MSDSNQNESMAKTIGLIVIVACVVGLASGAVQHFFFDELSPAVGGGITGGVVGGVAASLFASRHGKKKG